MLVISVPKVKKIVSGFGLKRPILDLNTASTLTSIGRPFASIAGFDTVRGQLQGAYRFPTKQSNIWIWEGVLSKRRGSRIVYYQRQDRERIG